MGSLLVVSRVPTYLVSPWEISLGYLPPPIPDTPSRRAQKRHHDSGESGLTTPKRTRTAAEGMTNPQAKTPRETHYPLHDTQKVKGINHAPPVAKTSPKNRLKYKNTKHVPAVRIFPQDDVTQKSVSLPPPDPQSADTPVPFIHALSEDERKLWNRSRNKATTSEKLVYKASWIAQATENNQLTDWAFGLKPMPPWACDSAKVRERIFDVRSRAAQELMDIVQDHLTETSASLKEESDKAMKGLEAAFNKDQKLSSKKSVEEHTDKHRPEYEQPRQGPPKRPRQSYDPRPSTSGQTNEGYGNQNQNWSNNRSSDRWTTTTHELSYNSFTPAPPTPAPRPAQQFYREDPAGQSYVVDYADDYNVGSEDATPPPGGNVLPPS